MKQTLAQARSFDWPVQLLLANQLTINIGFYMLMPYLAAHLSRDLGLAAWLVGLILGVRNLSQQGMFLVGGSLADRLGYKPMIVAGCALRTLGFALLGLVDSLPALIIASALTGFAGALFNPAVRAYLAHNAGERRVEAFALFNVFYQLGIFIGPLLGLVLTGIAFQATCLVAASLFAMLTILQLRALPPCVKQRPDAGPRSSLLADWRQVVTNRAFLLFSIAMIGAYVLTYQVYLTLPLEVRRITGTDTGSTLGVGLMFAVSGLLAMVGQVRITAWCKRRWTPAQTMTRGLAITGLAFVPLIATASISRNPAPVFPGTTGDLVTTVIAYATGLAPVLVTTALLTIGTMTVYPFEMDTIVNLADNRLVATHYGLYNTLSGIGITIGNLLSGAALDVAHATGNPSLPWIALTAVGAACTLSIHALHRTGRLTTAPKPVPAMAHQA